MATKKTSSLNPAKADSPQKNALGTPPPATVSGPAQRPLDAGALEGAASRQALQQAHAEALARSMPFNALKMAEHGLLSGHSPQAGGHSHPADTAGTASTLTENTASDKLGQGRPQVGRNARGGSLDPSRVDSGGRALTTNQGVQVADNQNSLKAGLRGPTLMEDFILREKITHFDHERIPERVVHARGSAAHGYFECYAPLADVTQAHLFSEAGLRTPVFVRFSTVAGERGSADTVRDTRGFAVKFYTQQGNWDLVGNNIPVFFIQDAMKFPDLVHAVKPEPHHGMPQASSAHDTFWDFMSLMPESVHHTLWVMSDRGIPRSYRTMQGFGVHTFRLVNAEGESVFVKFHWLPLAGTHSLVWDEAVKIAGADADFHRRDLWESIEAGNFPAYELALQVFTEAQAGQFSFDVLDPTKLVPEELVPLRAVGRMVLNRNPDNFFAETEQVAFCAAHVVPGIDFSNDPLLQGRIHSYMDTQISRLGGANFHEIPVNAPLAQVHNNQRDGLHRQAIARGRVAYEPNSLGGGCPHQAGLAGFVPFPEPVKEDKVRGKPIKFADHYSQASLFWRSQTPLEKRHIIAAFRFELSRVTVAAVRERVVSVLANVDAQLAAGVAAGLGMAAPPAAQPRALEPAVRSEVDASPSLSLFSRPGHAGAAGSRVALLVADGSDAQALATVRQALLQAQAVPRLLGPRLGRVTSSQGTPLEVDATVEAMPSVLWDAVVVALDEAALPALLANGQVLEFIKDQYRHCKPILAAGEGRHLLAAAGIALPHGDGDTEAAPADGGVVADPGLVLSDTLEDDDLADFVAALGRRKHFERETDPPKV
jgi:catalase